MIQNLITDNNIYLKRPYLHTRLSQSLQKPLTTVVAGAGYGKTQIVYEFLQDYDAITVWLQLSQFDNLPLRFWENFVYAVSLLDDKFASDFKKNGFPETLQEYSRFLVLLSNVMNSNKNYVLVCDDFHLINKKNILNFFIRLIDARIPNLSIIIISRKEPDINLMKLYSRDMVSIIDENILRFSKEEIIDYFKMQNIHLSTKIISDIYSSTEGWIFAIRLVGLSLSKGVNSEAYIISMLEQNISKLIESELFSTISKKLQEFLIKLSLIDNLTLELLIELSCGNAGIISEMNEISSFIRYDAFLRTYRIHHLFLTFLYKKQSLLSEEAKIEVYNKSAEWCAKNGYTVDALNYYEKAGEYDKMIETISTFYASCPEEIAKFILELLDRMPENIYYEKPFTQVIHAKFVLNCFQFEESYKELISIVEKYVSIPQTEENRVILGESYLLLGIIYFSRSAYTGDYAFQRYFKLADEYLPSGSTLINKYNFSFNTGGYSCIIARPIVGEFDKFIDAMRYTMPYATRVTNGSGSGTVYLCLAEKSYYQMEIKDVEKYASLAIDEALKQEQHTTECLAIFYLIKASISFGDYSKTMSLLEQTRAVCEKYNLPRAYKILDMTESWFYSQIKQPDLVADWIKGDSKNYDNATTPINYFLGRFAQAKYYLATQAYHELLVYLDKEENSRPVISLLASIENKVLRAVALYQVKETGQAILVLQEAYVLAASNALYMPFIEIGSKMRTLAKAAMKTESCTIPNQWLEMISTKSSSYAKRVSKIASEYRTSNHLKNDIRSDFTVRELALLTDLSHGLSREEIASDLDLSINTVKHMLQNVFDKLGAENTIDAVRIAILMKLVE